MDKIKFSDIYIGTPDGETEAQNPQFQELFCNSNNKYEELKNNKEKFLIIGSKGSGKTYLANYYCAKKGEREFCEIINSQSFWLDKLENMDSYSNEPGFVHALCKWFILNKLCEIVISKHHIRGKWLKYSSVYKLNLFVQQISDDKVFKSIKLKLTKEKELKNSLSKKNSYGLNENMLSLGGEMNDSIEAKSLKGETIDAERKHFFELIKSMENKIDKALSPYDKITLIFDDLDELDKKLVEDPNADIILNLIKVVKEYNIHFNKNGMNIRLILLVRTDILDKLQLYDGNLSKIKSSCGVELYWLTSNTDEPEKHPLINMVLHKIKTCCVEASILTDRELYNQLFPEKIDNKPVLDYLLDYSFGRPRDIITYLNHVINEFPEYTYFNATAFKRVKKLYSADFYNEMINESYFHQPPQYTQQCLNLLSGLKKTSFTFNMIKEFYEQNKELYHEIESVEEAVSFLYKIGAIGNLWKARNNHVYTSWAYRKDSMDDVDISKRLIVHYALRKKFSI